MIKRNSDLIILLILWIVSIYSVISVIFKSYEIGISNYMGYGLLIGISTLRYFKVKRFKTILGIILIVGSINAIQFTYSTITLIFTWSPLGNNFSSFGIQPLSISLLILLIGLNFSDFMRLLTNLFSEDPKFIAKRQKLIADKHYDRLINEKDSKLQDIIDNKNMYQIEYVNAAQKLIDERKTIKTRHNKHI